MSTTTGERASRLDGHPTVMSVRARQAAEPATEAPAGRAPLAAEELRALCLAAGADDVGFVEIFFFQAEDGIRDHCVTGVQTCALPIFHCTAVPAPDLQWTDGKWVSGEGN